MTKSILLAGLAAAFSIGVGVWQATYDCIYGGTRVQTESGNRSVPAQEYCSGSLVDVNGTGALIVLAFPVVFSVLGVMALRAGKRRPAWLTVLLLFAFCVLGLASVGIFYLPSLILLAIAVALSPKVQPPTGQDDSGDA